MRKIVFIAIAFSILFSPAFAVLEIANAQPKVGAKQWKQVLDSTWQGLKRRNIDAYSTGLIHRPKSETPGDAVSEGVGYGMLLALYANDQVYFDKIFKAGKQYGLNACQNWRINKDGSNGGQNSASDADEDIALALIFADTLQRKGIWKSSDINYKNEAQGIVDCIWNYLRSDGGLPPGNQWDPGYNIGYFAPAWYRIFNKFDSQKRDWMKVVNRSYSIIEANPAYDIGMVPDWASHSGGFYNGQPLGYNPYLSGRAFFKDAIRVLWRIANDAIWFDEQRAKTFLTKSLDFIKPKGPSAANFYQLEGANKGELVPAGDRWEEFNDENKSNTWRYRREHSHLTVGQWLTVAMAVGTDDDKIAWSSKMAEFYDWENKVDFFGNAVDPAGGLEDTLHNEMYFDQFLAWFGVSLMSGTWVNIMSDYNGADVEGITVQPFPENLPIKPKNKAPLGIQISQHSGILHLSSQSDVAWKIHNLQGKLLFSSNSRETSWNSGNFKGAVVVSAVGKSNAERRFLIVK